MFSLNSKTKLWLQTAAPYIVLVNGIALILYIVGIRFSNSTVQQIIMICYGLLFFPAIIAMFITASSRNKVAAVMKYGFGTILLLPAAAAFMTTCMNFLTLGFNSSDPMIQTIPLPTENIVLYQTSGGATYSSGVRIYSEKKLVPGLKYVTKIVDYYRVESMQLQYVGENKFKVLSIDLTALNARITNEYDSETPLPFVGDIVELQI